MHNSHLFNELKSSSSTDSMLSRKFNTTTALVAMTVLAAGAVCLYVSSAQIISLPSLQMMLIVAGFTLLPLSAYILFARSNQWVYNPTGSPVGEKNIFLSPDDVTKLNEELKTGCFDTIANLKPHNNGNCYLDVLYTKDKHFIALQIMKYGSFSYDPASPVFTFTGDRAEFVQQKIADKR